MLLSSGGDGAASAAAGSAAAATRGSGGAGAVLGGGVSIPGVVDGDGGEAGGIEAGDAEGEVFIPGNMGGRRQAFHRTGGPGSKLMPIYIEGDGDLAPGDVDEGGWQGAALEESKGPEEFGLDIPEQKIYILAQLELESGHERKKVCDSLMNTLMELAGNYKPGDDIQAYPDMVDPISMLDGINRVRFYLGTQNPPRLDRVVLGSHELAVFSPDRTEFEFGHFDEQATFHKRS